MLSDMEILFEGLLQNKKWKGFFSKKNMPFHIQQLDEEK
jgi:hypothetical protein